MPAKYLQRENKDAKQKNSCSKLDHVNFSGDSFRNGDTVEIYARYVDGNCPRTFRNCVDDQCHDTLYST